MNIIYETILCSLILIYTFISIRSITIQSWYCRVLFHLIKMHIVNHQSVQSVSIVHSIPQLMYSGSHSQFSVGELLLFSIKIGLLSHSLFYFILFVYVCVTLALECIGSCEWQPMLYRLVVVHWPQMEHSPNSAHLVAIGAITTIDRIHLCFPYIYNLYHDKKNVWETEKKKARDFYSIQLRIVPLPSNEECDHWNTPSSSLHETKSAQSWNVIAKMNGCTHVFVKKQVRVRATPPSVVCEVLTSTSVALISTSYVRSLPSGIIDWHRILVAVRVYGLLPCHLPLASSLLITFPLHMCVCVCMFARVLLPRNLLDCVARVSRA